MIDVESIKSSQNIVDYIDNYVPLKKNGKDHFGCCPFHNEKTPSFTVNEQKQFYYCFGCGAQGSVIDFVMEYQGVEFLQACEILGHNAALKPSETLKNRRENEDRKIELPLHYQEPLKREQMRDFLNKCEVFANPNGGEGIYFYQGSQALILTNVKRQPVTIALVKKGFDPRFYGREFRYGSCVINGDLSGDVYLCEDYHQSAKLHLTEGKNTICFFSALNLYFIYSEIKHKKVKIITVCKTDEAKFQAEKMIIETMEI